MKNLVSTEKMLKHWLKKRVTITTATVVGFLLMGTAAFGNTTEQIIKENTTHKEQIIHDDNDPIMKVINNGTIEINLKQPQHSDLSGIRLREERKDAVGEQYTKKLENNGTISVKYDGAQSVNGVKLLGNAKMVNNASGKISVEFTGDNTQVAPRGVYARITDLYTDVDNYVVENKGIIEVVSSVKEVSADKNIEIASAVRIDNVINKKNPKVIKSLNEGRVKVKADEKTKVNVVYLATEKVNFENTGTIILEGGNNDSVAISAMADSEVKNSGVIEITSNGKVVRGNKSFAGKVTNTGIIKITDKTVKDLENVDANSLFINISSGKLTNTGMLVDKDGIAVGRDGEVVVDSKVSSAELNTKGKNEGKVILTQGAEITGGDKAINVGALEIRNNIKVTGDKLVKIEDTTINLDKNGKLSIDGGKTLSIKGNNINKSEKGTAIALGDGSTLSLDGVTVINGAIGEVAEDGSVKGTVEAKDTTINGNIATANFNVIGGTKEEVNTTIINGEIAVGTITVGKTPITSKLRNSIELDKNVTDKLVLSSDSKFTNTTGSTLTINKNGQVFLGIDKDGNNAFKNTTSGSVTVKGDSNGKTTDLVLETGNLSGDNIKIGFGEKVTFDGTDRVTVGTDSKIYVVDKNKAELNGTNKDVIVSYNTKLYEDNAVLNNVNNAAKVVSNLFSNDVAEREVQLDKIYSSNIYSETVKAAYDTVKMNEEAVLSLARKSEVGKWTAEGKALYSKDEYDRKGTVGEYSSEIESTGLMAAFGYGLNETTTAGVAFSGVKQDVDTDGGSADADLFYLGVYGNKVYGNYDFTAGLGYQFGEYEADNTIANVHGSDKYDSKALSGYVQGRYTADLGDGLSLQPRVRLGYTYVEQDDTRDSYFGVSDAEISTFDAEFGLDTVKSVQLEKSKVDVKFGVSYVRTMGDTDDEFTGRFYGTTASEGFNVLGAELAENVVKFNLGAEVTNENGFFYNGGLTYEFGSDDTDAYGVNVGVGYRF